MKYKTRDCRNCIFGKEHEYEKGTLSAVLPNMIDCSCPEVARDVGRAGEEDKINEDITAFTNKIIVTLSNSAGMCKYFRSKNLPKNEV